MVVGKASGTPVRKTLRGWCGTYDAQPNRVHDVVIWAGVPGLDVGLLTMFNLAAIPYASYNATGTAGVWLCGCVCLTDRGWLVIGRSARLVTVLVQLH